MLRGQSFGLSLASCRDVREETEQVVSDALEAGYRLIALEAA